MCGSSEPKHKQNLARTDQIETDPGDARHEPRRARVSQERKRSGRGVYAPGLEEAVLLGSRVLCLE